MNYYLSLFEPNQMKPDDRFFRKNLKDMTIGIHPIGENQLKQYPKFVADLLRLKNATDYTR